jgi:hypothetical protein
VGFTVNNKHSGAGSLEHARTYLSWLGFFFHSYDTEQLEHGTGTDGYSCPRKSTGPKKHFSINAIKSPLVSLLVFVPNYIRILFFAGKKTKPHD